jgi:adenylosuccinate lyase
MTVDFENYQSPFSWRYGSKQMRQLFSEVEKRKTWRKIWAALASAQNKYGLISKKELEDIIKHQGNIDIAAAHKIEAQIKHDLMAEVRTFASQAKIGGGKIHLGATSQDIEDNADALIFKKAIAEIENELKSLLKIWALQISKYKNLVCMAYTHLQPAEPTTLGYRFSLYAQDLLLDLELLNYVKGQIKGKGLKGAVGNAASYVSLVGQKAERMEKEFLTSLGIEAFDVTGQVYPRKLDYLILTLLASIAQSLHKFCFDLRIMQSAPFGEIAEPFGEKQVGSSAMPFKRNPQNAERVCSLARYISQLPQVAWGNAANSGLERTLDDSAAKRIIIPDGFLATEEILKLTIFIVKDLNVNEKAIAANLAKYGSFSALEAVLLKSTKNGANRQDMHELLRSYSLKVYKEMEEGKDNNLFSYLKKDREISKYLKHAEIERLSNVKTHIGLAPKIAAEFAQRIKQNL